LIDNLDRAWVKDADVLQLSPFLLGLFGAASQLVNDFSRQDSRRKRVNCTAAIFLRSDIFNRVYEIAREPDKLAVTRLSWNDTEMLSHVLERRFLNAHPAASSGAELWTRYFCTSARNKTPRDYILSRILPRPRDIVYFVKTAISVAVNRGHARIEEDDILKAEYEYSKYALDSIMVENSITIPELTNVLYEFTGSPVIVGENEVRAGLGKAGIPAEKYGAVRDHLIFLNFIGIEIEPDRFVYVDDPREVKKFTVLANKISEQRGLARYQVHPAFRAYLEMNE